MVDYRKCFEDNSVYKIEEVRRICSDGRIYNCTKAYRNTPPIPDEATTSLGEVFKIGLESLYDAEGNLLFSCRRDESGNMI